MTSGIIQRIRPETGLLTALQSAASRCAQCYPRATESSASLTIGENLPVKCKVGRRLRSLPARERAQRSWSKPALCSIRMLAAIFVRHACLPWLREIWCDRILHGRAWEVAKRPVPAAVAMAQLQPPSPEPQKPCAVCLEELREPACGPCG